MRAKDVVGHFGEQVAAEHLESVGMIVLERNWRCRAGEIDIVARDGDALVFCEVKTRTGVGYGSPFAAVTRVKAGRLRQLAAAWLAAHDQRAPQVRFDVLGVLRPTRGDVTVEHRRGVI